MLAHREFTSIYMPNFEVFSLLSLLLLFSINLFFEIFILSSNSWMPGLWSSFMGISYRIYIMVFAIVTDRILELISNTTRIWPKFGYIGKLN